MRSQLTRTGLFAVLGLLLSSGAARADRLPFSHQRIAPSQTGQRRWLSSTGLQYTEKTLRGVLEGKNRAGTAKFDGGWRGALSSVEAAWSFVKKHPGDPRVAVQDQGDGVKVYTVDMHRRVGEIGDTVKGTLPAEHVRIVVARERVLIGAAATRGAHYDGYQWKAPTLGPAQHPAQALDDAGLARSMVAAGARPQIAARAVDHVRMGLPTAASYAALDDRLRVRNGYVMSMNGDTRVLNWVSWMTTKDHIDDHGKRSDNWRTDPTLGEDFPKADGDDYRGAGSEYHRGHMVRSRERSAKMRENEKTFVYSNAVPQSKSNNIGPWNGLEEWVRTQAQAGYRVLNLAGPAFSGPKKTLGSGVAIPTSLWKVVALLGPNEQTVSPTTRVVAVMIPNDHSVPITANWADYRVPVEKIEQATGFRFFNNLPQGFADQLRKQIDGQHVPYVMPPHVKEELDRQAQRKARRTGGAQQQQAPAIQVAQVVPGKVASAAP